MSTTKSRINISLSEEMKVALEKFARRDSMPYATKAARLLEAALEIEEDRLWNEIAERRDAKKARYLPHRRAWK